MRGIRYQAALELKSVWQEIKHMDNIIYILFKDFIVLQRGFDLPKKDMIDGPFPVVGSTSVIGYHNESKVDPPGVITGRSGSLGFVQYIRDKYWPHNTSLWVKDFKGNFPRYVYYYLQILNLQRFNSGAGVPTLNRNDLDTLEIAVHSVPTQRKIASILSAYDDLIENNNRRIKILEEMAQAIYKEWFVNFRFPGHEKIKMVKSELGMIPEGWKIKKLGEVCNIVMGQSPRSEFYNTKGEGLPFHQGVKDFKNRFPIHRTYCTDEKRIAVKNDILVSVRAPVGRLNIANRRLIIGRGLSAIQHQENLQSFLYYQLKEIFLEKDTMGSGSIFHAITKEDLYKLKFLVPDKELDKKFDILIDPMDREIENLSQKNNNLRKTRDLLLPKLISGEIDVEDLDIKIQEAKS